VHFDLDVVDPGQPSHWSCLRADGIRYPCTSTAVSFGDAKLIFVAPGIPSPIVGVTYDNALGTGYDLLLRPLFTGSDFPCV